MTFRASAHICLCGPVLGADVLSHSGESADFGSVSLIDNVHRSPSLSGVSECSRSLLVDRVRLGTYDQVDGTVVGLLDVLVDWSFHRFSQLVFSSG